MSKVSEYYGGTHFHFTFVDNLPGGTNLHAYKQQHAQKRRQQHEQQELQRK